MSNFVTVILRVDFPIPLKLSWSLLSPIRQYKYYRTTPSRCVQTIFHEQFQQVLKGHPFSVT